MNGVGDSNSFDNDFENLDEFQGKKYKEDQEIKQLKKQYKRNLLTNAQKSFIFLEHQSLVDYVETDGEYIATAGRDHDINVWDAIEGRHIRRLSGHAAPVTGLHLHVEQDFFERIIISASEDGTIKKWSLNKGEELESIETDNLITCMGIINKMLVVTGNHKGYMEIYHLDIGELYSSILAHEDPIDALKVKGKYACTATFEVPSCLKVWEIQFERTTCIYRIENSPDIEFSSLALWNTTAILGASNERKLHLIDFKTDEKGIIDLGSRGSIQHVRVWNEWILSYSLYKRDTVLDVHRIHKYEHFGTFSCNMQQVYATAAMESDSSFRIIMGGSALAILSFDFILTQEAKVSFQSEKPSCVQNRSKSHYTLKNTIADEDDGESSLNSEGENSSNDLTHPCKTIISKFESESKEICLKNLQKEKELQTNASKRENEAIGGIIRQKQMSIFARNMLTTSIKPPSMKDNQLFLQDKISLEKMFQSHAEPRVAVRKLEEFLDENKKSDLRNCIKDNENYEALQEARNNLLRQYDAKKHEENFNEINLVTNTDLTEKKENKIEKDETNTAELITESSKLLNINTNDLNTESKEHRNDTPQENDKKYVSKFCPKKKERGKTDKKKSSEKAKQKRCLVM